MRRLTLAAAIALLLVPLSRPAAAASIADLFNLRATAAVAVVVVPVAVVPAKPEPPLYWGFGGRPRPGSWTPPSQ